MADVTYENALRAMRVAHDKGDMDAAKKMAALAKSLEGQSSPANGFLKKEGFMGHLNEGIAQSAGGLVDFINPFDKPHTLNPFPQGTGSAKDGIRAALGVMGTEFAENAPETVAQGFARGAGEAAAVAPVAGGVAALLSKGAGTVANVADDTYRALATRAGFATEAVAGGVGEAAATLAGEAGAPDWVQETARIAAPGVALPAAVATARAASPVGAVARRIGPAIAEAAAPYTKAGATEVARKRVTELAGGPERAAELAARIRPETEFGLTPAQQTGDPNFLALEKAAAGTNPELRDRLSDASDAAQAAAKEALSIGGATEGASAYFTRRVEAAKARLGTIADRAMLAADKEVSKATTTRTESDASRAGVTKIKKALGEALETEAALWGRIPKGAQVGTNASRAAANRWVEELGPVGADNIPAKVRQFLLDPNGLDEAASVRDMHRLYSDLRETARNAMAGGNQRKTLAAVANSVADAILEDLGAKAGTTEVGRLINEARAFSRALHETFDQGATGRILKRTLDGDETIAPDAAFARTVGSGGASGMADARSVLNAAPDTDVDLTDYFRKRFGDVLFDASGNFTPKRASTWMRANAESLSQFPELRDQFRRSIVIKRQAENLSKNAIRRASMIDQAAGKFLGRPPENAVAEILSSNDPEAAARAIVQQASKDPSRAALEGVKGAFSRYLISKTSSPADGAISARSLENLLASQQRVLSQVYNGPEIKRLKTISDELSALAAASRETPDIGSISSASPNKIMEIVIRVAAARNAAQMGGGMAGGLQAAQMASSRVKSMMKGLTNDRATQILVDAVEDPELMKALLTEISGPKDARAIANKLAPYFVGAVSGISDSAGSPTKKGGK